MNLLSGIQQDFHRPQKLPGAYEWWHFDGTDSKTGFSFSLQFFAGNPFSPYYQDNLKTFWQKTKSPLTEASTPQTSPPPYPLDYCSIIFRLFRNENLIAESLEAFSGKFLKASDHHGAVKLGPSRFNWDENGNPASYVITLQTPFLAHKGNLRARLFFTPLLEDIPGLPSPEISSTHTWVLAAPMCHVEGTLQWCNHSGNVEKEEGFVGKGYHDHHWGSIPLDRFIKSWHWGRSFAGDKTFIYSIQTPAHKSDPTESLLLILDKNKVESIHWNTEVQLESKRFNFFGLPYEKKLVFNHPNRLKIKHESILSDGPVSLIFQDQLRWEDSKADLTGSGISNYLYTPRLCSRLFFPMLKAKTTVYTTREEVPLSNTDQPEKDVFTDRPTS